MLAPIVIALLALGVLSAVLLLRKRVATVQPAITEYWVYLPGDSMPTQDALFDRVIKEDTLSLGRPPAGREEGLLFSDVRLHLGLVLRAKNPHVFRPDLFEAHVEPTAEILEGLSHAKSLVKIRYASEQTLPDERHLRLLPFLAEAVAAIGQGSVVFDVTAERLMTLDELRGDLVKAGVGNVLPEQHVRAIWAPSPSGGRACTRGLVKMGLPELRTRDVATDEKVLALYLVESAATEIWRRRTLPDELEIEAYGDLFRLQFFPARRGPVETAILRVQRS
ncbi:MAG: hypothetical protein HY248_01915 [Fimbriimonas ginsengisoli]|uniref:Uncharacterized protein n=1 Tax=Fimbriimonas ginsengisoli TaxID=1005039 RepID=A0A931LWR9_FIMGI|nr:hypothetical protein [Fimbriimonas ginsengisoli]MBI3721283.1 hypothetical protein [Fimbriimonas ginsengisoli]